MSTQTGVMAGQDETLPEVGGVGSAALPQELAEQLVARARAAGVSLTGPGGLLTGLTRQVLKTALSVEMSEHLGHEHGEPAGAGGNVRNRAHRGGGRADRRAP